MTDEASIPFTRDQIEFVRTWMRVSPRNRLRSPCRHLAGTRAQTTSPRPGEDPSSGEKANLHCLTVATDDGAHLVLTNYCWHSHSHTLAHICTPYTHGSSSYNKAITTTPSGIYKLCIQRGCSHRFTCKPP